MDHESFPPDLTIKTVPDLWTQYTIGLNGSAPTRAFYEIFNPYDKFSTHRTSQVTVHRRRVDILDLVQELAVDYDGSGKEAAVVLEAWRLNQGFTLTALGDKLERMSVDSLRKALRS
jgi:hypothetical protein